MTNGKSIDPAARRQDPRELLFPPGVRLSVVVPVFNERYLVTESLTRLLDLPVPEGGGLEIVVVDDGSSDGSADVVQRLVDAHPGRLRLIRRPENAGKGAALRDGIEAATGDLIVFHDADLEYDPRDLIRMAWPFRKDGADVVYGSRFSTSERRRVLSFRHTFGNRMITLLSNLFTDLNLTDVETCYKMFRAPILESLPLRSNDFRIEVEVTAKISKRNCVVFEIPISYRGRTYREGKKIDWRDGFRALGTILHYWVIDDLYKQDEYGGEILYRLERAQRFDGWMADALRPWLGGRILEIGAGIGNMTTEFVPRDLYVASDTNSSYLHYLRNLAAGRPYLEVERIDLEDGETFEGHQGRFDTVICLSILENLSDPVAALRRIASTLTPGGRVVLYVPRGPGLYSGLDEALGHRCRYDRQSLRRELESAGFEVEEMKTFNRASVPGWWWNGKVMRRKTFSRWQLKIFSWLVPILRRVDRFLPWKGLGIVAVARKSDE